MAAGSRELTLQACLQHFRRNRVSPLLKNLSRPVADQIRKTAAEAEAMRRLPDDLMRILKDAGLFSIYTPRQFGGLDLAGSGGAARGRRGSAT
jgi:alkylation response protein AidB-like acyl-CoA dehydrogenase